MRCPKCKDDGFKFEENSETKEMEAIPCDCRKAYDTKKIEYALHKKYEAAGISSSFWKYTFDSFKFCPIGNLATQKINANQINILKAHAQDPESFFSKYSTLWLYSSLGNAGCTTLAICFGMELIRQKYIVRFVTMQKLLNAFVEFDDKKNFFQDINKADVFILDNVFVGERCSIRGEYTAVQLYDWLNNALLDGKKFICTSRVPLDRVDKTYENSVGIFKKHPFTIEIHGTKEV